MRCRWAARLLVLALVVGVSDSLGAQGQSSRDVVTGSELRQNQPNPFESETSRLAVIPIVPILGVSIGLVSGFTTYWRSWWLCLFFRAV